MDFTSFIILFFLPYTVIIMHPVANFHNVIEIWEPGKQVVWLSKRPGENWNGGHSHHCVLLDCFCFAPLFRESWWTTEGSWNTALTHFENGNTNTVPAMLGSDWNFVVQGESVWGRKKEAWKKTEIIWFANFCPNLCLTLKTAAEKGVSILQERPKYARLLWMRLRHYYEARSIKCKIGCIKMVPAEQSDALLHLFVKGLTVNSVFKLRRLAILTVSEAKHASRLLWIHEAQFKNSTQRRWK